MICRWFVATKLSRLLSYRPSVTTAIMISEHVCLRVNCPNRIRTYFTIYLTVCSTSQPIRWGEVRRKREKIFNVFPNSLLFTQTRTRGICQVYGLYTYFEVCVRVLRCTHQQYMYVQIHVHQCRNLAWFLNSKLLLEGGGVFRQRLYSTRLSTEFVCHLSTPYATSIDQTSEEDLHFFFFFAKLVYVMTQFVSLWIIKY